MDERRFWQTPLRRKDPSPTVVLVSRDETWLDATARRLADASAHVIARVDGSAPIPPAALQLVDAAFAPALPAQPGRMRVGDTPAPGVEVLPDDAASLARRLDAWASAALEAQALGSTLVNRALVLAAQRGDDIVEVTDAEVRLVWANAAYEQTLGEKASAIVGLRPRTLTDAGLSVPGLEDTIRRSLDAEGFWTGEILTRDVDGRPVLQHTRIDAIADDDGPLGYLARKRPVPTYGRGPALGESAALLSGWVDPWFIHGERGDVIQTNGSGRLLLDAVLGPDAPRSLHAVLDDESWAMLARRDPALDARLLRVRDGSGRAYSARSREVEVANTVLILTVFREQTELARVTASLRTAREKAEDALRRKARFVAYLTHELRTPLQAIVSFAELAAEQDSGPMRDVLIARLREASLGLSRLVDECLDHLKLDSGHIGVESVPFVLDVLLADAATMVRPADGVELVVDVAPGTPERWLGDPFRLRQILLNLLANASRFTQVGAIVVLARAQSKAPAPTLEIVVRDTGIGMSADTLQRLFEPFAQAEASTARRFGGTGLGLSISRQLATALGGTLTVASAPNEGTTFTLRLAQPVLVSPPWSGTLPTRVRVIAPPGLIRTTLLRDLDQLGVGVDDGEPGHGDDPAEPMTVVLDARLLSEGVAVPTESVRDGDRLVVFGVAASLPPELATRVDAVLPGAPTRSLLRTALSNPAFAPAASHAPERHRSSSPAGLRLLLVDDDEDSRTLVELLLARAGIVVDAVPDAETALERLATPTSAAGVDALLIDGQLPGMHGAEAIAALRARPWLREFPIVVLTGEDEEGPFVRSGADRVLFKPIDGSTLRDTIGALVERRSRRH